VSVIILSLLAWGFIWLDKGKSKQEWNEDDDFLG
jgi:hypothetical protein